MGRAEKEAERAKRLAGQVARIYAGILGANLTGVYMHGSLALGGFHWATGDIDLLVVTYEQPSDVQKEAMARVLIDLWVAAPPKGFEMSVVLKRSCAAPRCPAPYEFHFSGMHLARAQSDLPAYCAGMHGLDPDLAAHFAVVRSAGLALCGERVEDVFGEVPQKEYLSSVMSDLADAEGSMKAAPASYVLNLCRTLAYLRTGRMLSKEAGGRWALDAVDPKLCTAVRSALRSHTEGSAFQAQEQAVFQLCSFVMREMERHDSLAGPIA